MQSFSSYGSKNNVPDPEDRSADCRPTLSFPKRHRRHFITGETSIRMKPAPAAVLIGIILLPGGALSAMAAGPGTPKQPEPSAPHLVRACVIGGMTMTGLWDEIVKRFEARHPFKVKVVATGPRPKISVPFRRGEADFLVMHSGDITTDLVADGYGINMRPQRPGAPRPGFRPGRGSRPQGRRRGAETHRSNQKPLSRCQQQRPTGSRPHPLETGRHPAEGRLVHPGRSTVLRRHPGLRRRQGSLFHFGRMPIT